MATRVHILASRGTDEASWRRCRELWAKSTEHRRGVEGRAHADWWGATASPWSFDGPAAEWLVGLQRDVRVLARLDLPYGGRARDLLAWARELVEDAGQAWRADAPLGEGARQALQAAAEDEGERADTEHEEVLRRLLAGTVGAVGGGVAAFLLVVAVGVALVLHRLRTLRQAIVGEQSPDQEALLARLDDLEEQQAEQLGQVMSDRVGLARRVGIDLPAPSLLARMHPLLQAVQDDSARRLATGLLEGGDLPAVRRRMDKLRLAVLDAELAGLDATGLRGELEAVADVVSS